MEIRILHNTDSYASSRGYKPGDAVIEVYRYYCYYNADVSRRHDPKQNVRLMFSISEDPATWSLHPCPIDYHLRGNRPVSVGDVIAIDNTFSALAENGWEEIEPPHVVTICQPGSVPFTTPVVDPDSAIGVPLIGLYAWIKTMEGEPPEVGLTGGDFVEVLLDFVSVLGIDLRDDLASAIRKLRERSLERQRRGRRDMPDAV